MAATRWLLSISEVSISANPIKSRKFLQIQNSFGIPRIYILTPTNISSLGYLKILNIWDLKNLNLAEASKEIRYIIQAFLLELPCPNFKIFDQRMWLKHCLDSGMANFLILLEYLKNLAMSFFLWTSVLLSNQFCWTWSFLPDGLQKRKAPKEVWQVLHLELQPHTFRATDREAVTSINPETLDDLNDGLDDSGSKGGKDEHDSDNAQGEIVLVKELYGGQDVSEDVQRWEQNIEDEDLGDDQ